MKTLHLDIYFCHNFVLFPHFRPLKSDVRRCHVYSEFLLFRFWIQFRIFTQYKSLICAREINSGRPSQEEKKCQMQMNTEKTKKRKIVHEIRVATDLTKIE